MNFQHTEDRRMLADSLNRFVAEQYGLASREAGFNADMWGRFAELGVIGALFKEADGGFGGDGFDIAVVFESLGRGLVVEPFLGALVVGHALAHAGNEAQKALIASLIEGRAIAALAHDERDSHYELSNVSTRAVRNSNGWVLTGAKAVVQQGEHADFFLVSARTKGARDAEEGISLFIVARDTAGIELRGYPKIDGGRAAELRLNEVCIGDHARLGERDAGFATLERSIGAGVLALCAEALGAMDVAKEHTLEYLRTRRQFGIAIGTFQALQHRMADMLLEIEQARSAVINAAAALGAGRIERERALSAAKYTIGRIGALVAEESIQMHGGIGMTWELPLAHYAKRLVMIDHQLGDEDHHLQRYIALNRS
ncbi:acyl-CoA dehydrogenase family protein [Caballeronia cordobensis]|uniref:acyl-CoA dehydrogenase family protein n=1 Tax=Caballeronia cordobensis TaxID=1353886 RepID=UPI0006AD6312|nr:acyl-CoA dehydrogenase family protein [Caballeronia cordobensis]